MNGYDLSRRWFDFCFENPELISPNHSAIYFFAIEHCNRLGWKNKFGFPTQMTMDAIGIKKHQTYIHYFNDLCNWKFFNLIEKSKNQYSANIISLESAMPENGKALDKAIIKHTAKQTETNGQSNGQSNSSIDKPLTNNQEQLKQQFFDFWELYPSKRRSKKEYCFEKWIELTEIEKQNILEILPFYIKSVKAVKYLKLTEYFFKGKKYLDDTFISLKKIDEKQQAPDWMKKHFGGYAEIKEVDNA